MCAGGGVILLSPVCLPFTRVKLAFFEVDVSSLASALYLPGQCLGVTNPRLHGLSAKVCFSLTPQPLTQALPVICSVVAP